MPPETSPLTLIDEQRKVQDPIYGTIYFPKLIWKFIDTPHVQRLRRIKQLGCLEYVFPCATHTRFEHSLGTSHLARYFIQQIIKNNPQKYEKQDKQSAVKTITLAGLLHDIGHGPFGHIFDTTVVTQIESPHDKKRKKWSHILGSQLLLRDMMKLQELKGLLDQQEVKRIIDLIKGNPKSDSLRRWQFDIIHNKRNGIDVNKLDYFRRDARYLRAKNIFISNQLIMSEARIINEEICYPTKYSQAVFNIYHSRYKLFKNYHFNVVNRGIQIMISDVLNLIKNKFQFQRKCNDIEKDARQFIELTDQIVDNVESTYQQIKQSYERSKDHVAKQLEKEKKAFQQALDILKRIETRDLYRFVKQLKYYILEKQDAQVVYMFDKQLKKQKIIKQISQEIADINPNSISVTLNDVGFGFQQFNPMKKVGFFRMEQIPHVRLKQQQTEKLTMLRSNAHIQRSIKIYVRKNLYKLYLRVDSAFSEFREKFNRKCQYRLKKESGIFYIFQGSGGKKPKKPTPQNQNLNPNSNSNNEKLSIQNSSTLTQKEQQKSIQQKKQEKRRKLNDPVHGLIYFDQLIWDFIDTPQFQRLRKMKQLQSLQYSFHCTKHTRFEHSIGNAYLASKFIQYLIRNNPDDYKGVDKASAIKTVTLAGLLRDIGHLPFNDILQRKLLKEVRMKGTAQVWKTSYASTVIFQFMMRKYQHLSKHLTEKQKRRVKDLIRGQSTNQQVWEFQIVNNIRNGIDVSLFESLRRDSFRLGTKNIYIDHNLLMKQAKIIDNKISYPTKYVETVYYIFQSRYKLRKDYYYEPASISIQLMFSDIFNYVDGKFKIKQICENIEDEAGRFLQLDDEIIDKIQFYYEKMNEQDPFKEKFAKAKDLLDRINNMDFYIFVKEMKNQVESKQGEGSKQFIYKKEKARLKEEIRQMLKGCSVQFDIDISDVGFGFEDQNDNIMKKVDFFRKEDVDLKARFTKVAENQIEELSMLYTHASPQRSIKVFMTSKESQQHFTQLKQAFVQACRKLYSKSVYLGQTGSSPTSKNKERKISGAAKFPNELIDKIYP